MAIFLPTVAVKAYAVRNMAILGKRNILSIVRASTPGLYLDGGELGEILLPGRYIPANLKPKDKLDVFIYRDSEDRLVATTETPLATVGEFAAMKVVSINDRVGAFLDWGLAKDLLLPFREQERMVRVGQRVVVFVYIDPKTQRIVASSRLHRHFESGASVLSQQPAGESPHHGSNATRLPSHRRERAQRFALSRQHHHSTPDWSAASRVCAQHSRERSNRFEPRRCGLQTRRFAHRANRERSGSKRRKTGIRRRQFARSDSSAIQREQKSV